MATISVYLGEEDERKRRKTNKRLALAAGCLLALLAIGKREPPAPLEIQAPPPPPQVVEKIVEKIVYVDRPVFQYAGPIGPVAPTPQPKPIEKRIAKPHRAIAQRKPAPIVTPTPPPIPTTIPAPAPRLIIAPPLLAGGSS